jgi:hypothetical protein
VTGIYRVARRTLLADLGRGALAVAVLGWSACGDDDDGGSAGRVSSSSTEPEARDDAPAEALVDHRVSLGFVSAYVLARGLEAAVVDTGVAGSAPQLSQGLQAIGVAWEDVRHLVITHHHPDHAGSVADVMGAAADAAPAPGRRTSRRSTHLGSWSPSRTARRSSGCASSPPRGRPPGTSRCSIRTAGCWSPATR